MMTAEFVEHLPLATPRRGQHSPLTVMYPLYNIDGMGLADDNHARRIITVAERKDWRSRGTRGDIKRH